MKINEKNCNEIKWAHDDEITWTEMAWYQMKSTDMTWNKMKWNGMTCERHRMTWYEIT